MNMNRYRFGIMLLLVANFFACAKNQGDGVIIRWGVSNKYEEINWYIDDDFVGVGDVGYDRIYEKLSSLKNRALVKVVYPFELWNPSVVGYSAESVIPLPDGSVMKSKMIAIFEKNHLRFQLYSYEEWVGLR